MLALAVLAAGAGVPPGASAAPGCIPLQRLVGLAPTRFERLRGFFDPRFDAWVSTYRMPGTSLCTIQDAEDIAVYTCTWEFPPGSSAVDETYAGVQRMVTACLDVRESSRDSPDEHSETTRFGLASGRDSVLVGKHRSPVEGDSVTLEVVPLGFHELPGP